MLRTTSKTSSTSEYEYILPKASSHEPSCYTSSSTSEHVFTVDDYPITPHEIIPFADEFVNPTIATRSSTDDGIYCRQHCSDSDSDNDSKNHCVLAYEINVIDQQLRMFDKSIPSCQSFPATWFLTYNGTIPGPTFLVPVGHETLVRMNNNISNRYFNNDNDTRFSCGSDGDGDGQVRKGRPISTHLHGSGKKNTYFLRDFCLRYARYFINSIYIISNLSEFKYF